MQPQMVFVVISSCKSSAAYRASKLLVLEVNAIYVAFTVELGIKKGSADRTGIFPFFNLKQPGIIQFVKQFLYPIRISGS